MAAVFGVAFVLWPACVDGLPCKQRETIEQRLRDIALDIVPPLKKRTPTFIRMGELAFLQRNSSDDCVAPLMRWLESAVGGFVSSPAKVRQVTQYIGVDQLSVVRAALGDLWTEAQNFSLMAHQSAACVRNNAPLRSYICAALGDPSLRPKLLNTSPEDLSMAAHLYLVLERLGSAARDRSDFRATLGQHFERVSDDIVATILAITKAQGWGKEILKFRVGKWYSIPIRPELPISMRAAPLRGAGHVQYLLQMNILEATFIDHDLGIQDNTDLGIALSVDVATQTPFVDSSSRIVFPLGKDWIDAYIAWNMNYVSLFGELAVFAKLLIPSIICTSVSDTTVEGNWSRPVPEMWVIAREVTLKAALAFMYNWEAAKIASGVHTDNMVMSPHAREEWGRISMLHSSLPHPPDCCGKGSLNMLYDQVLPYGASEHSPTSEMPSEWFLFYCTMVMWVMVLFTGFGSEFVVGVPLSKHLSEGSSEIFWTTTELLFPICLTVALFSQSVFGLPFLCVGLWKCGYPETRGYFLSAMDWLSLDRARAVSLYLAGLGLALHHASTSLTICATCRGLFPLSRPLVSACVVPVLQHSAYLVKYNSKVAHRVVVVLLEVVFEWEVLGNLASFESEYGLWFSRFGRGCALTMLVAHWLYVLSAALDIVVGLYGSAKRADVGAVDLALSTASMDGSSRSFAVANVPRESP
ncbi:unnamed protein product [Polarella glacialis]|nr:unnamed protein product [Polarella glacialis]